MFSTVATTATSGVITAIFADTTATTAEAGMVDTAATVNIATDIVVIPMVGGIRWQHSEQGR